MYKTEQVRIVRRLYPTDPNGELTVMLERLDNKRVPVAFSLVTAYPLDMIPGFTVDTFERTRYLYRLSSRSIYNIRKTIDHPGQTAMFGRWVPDEIE